MSYFSPDELYEELHNVLDLPKELIQLILSYYSSILIDPIKTSTYMFDVPMERRDEIESIVLSDETRIKVSELRMDMEKDDEQSFVILLKIINNKIEKRRNHGISMNRQWDIHYKKIYPNDSNCNEIENKIGQLFDGVLVCEDVPIVFPRISNKPLEEMNVLYQDTLDRVGLGNYAFRIEEFVPNDQPSSGSDSD